MWLETHAAECLESCWGNLCNCISQLDFHVAVRLVFSFTVHLDFADFRGRNRCTLKT